MAGEALPLPARVAVSRALELLWGVEARLAEPVEGVVAWVERPWGFRVVEVGPRPAGEGGGWRVFLLYSLGVDSLRAARLVAKALGARGVRVSGLKDACAHSYQYIALRGGRVGRVSLALGGGRIVEAHPLPLRGSLRPGAHLGNAFRLSVHVHGDGARLCHALSGLRVIPGYYGPQRFGVERPNTHYLGLLAGLGEAGELLREYSTRYPLEPRRPPGDYEARALVEAARAGSPWAVGHGWIRGFALEALRSYVFNRALSRALASGDVRGYGEHWVTVPCPGRGGVRVPAARLPGRGLGSRSKWARLVWEVAEEEGVAWVLARAARAGPFRPLVYPVCRSWCRPSGGVVEWVLTLPRGAYATVALREAAVVDWVEYSRCRLAGSGRANG